MNHTRILKEKSLVIVFSILGLLLIYTRFLNLGWGLPYPFHPDERNLADAMMRLHCTGLNVECFNPHFFAYGQFPLYLGYLGIQAYHLFVGMFNTSITFIEATLSLRLVSAVASVLTFLVMIKMIEFFIPKIEKKPLMLLGMGIFFIFSPGLIQFAHFGTTESLLMLFYTTLVYFGLLGVSKKLSLIKYAALSGLVTGLAIATKASSLSFLLVPVAVILYHHLQKRSKVTVGAVFILGCVTAATGILFSPLNLIVFQDFQSSIQYESAIGLGKLLVFYTRQFAMTVPVLFQFSSIFSYALGITATVLFLGSLLFLPSKKEYNFLRFAFLVYFLPTAFLFTKWTRFVAPLFPLMLMLVVLFIIKVLNDVQKRASFKESTLPYVFLTLIIIVSVPGILFMSVYRNPDIRFTASDWIYKNIPANSVILSESGNVVDLPLVSPERLRNSSAIPAYQMISLFLYDLDSDREIQQELSAAIKKADYIIVPSRRVFMNQTCFRDDGTQLKGANCEYLKQRYPITNQYYEKLFNGTLGFKKIKEFKSPGENAEETWTVFDHPTIRIYQRVKKD